MTDIVPSRASHPLDERANPPRERRTLVVIDMVESVRLMLAYEADVIQRWRRLVEEVRLQILPRHRGRMVKSLGDGSLLEFANVHDAVHAALAIQETVPTFNVGRPADALIHLRAGIHEADVVVDALDVYGAGVNLAARLTALAEPGQIVVSAQVQRQLIPDFDADVHDLGDCYLKHIEAPMRVFRIARHQADGPPQRARLPHARALVPRIAVLPLVDTSDEARLLRAGESLADDLIAHMSRSAFWQVTSRMSTVALARRDLGLHELAEALKVDFVLTGQVSLAGTNALVKLEAAEVTTGTVVWQEQLERKTAQLMTGEEAFARHISMRVMKAVLRREIDLGNVSALPNLPSYALLLQSISLLHSLSPTQFDRAHDTLKYLEERHPRSPDVLAWLAKWHVFRTFQRWSPDHAREIESARRYLDRAHDLDPTHALTHALKGHVASAIDCNPQAAEAHLRTALQHGPNEPLAWLFLAHVLACLDRTDESIAAIEQARALSPLDPMAYFYDVYAAWVYGAAGLHDEALRSARRSAATNAYHLPSLTMLMIALQRAGLSDEARQTAQRYLTLRPDASVQRFIDSHPAGNRPIARREAEALLAAGLPL